MLQIPRSLIRQVRSVCRRAGIKAQKALENFVQVQAGPEGLSFRAWSADIALTFHEPQEQPSFTALVPLSILADCEGRRTDFVTFAPGPKDKELTATWQEGNVPQQRAWNQGPDISFDKFPVPPEGLTENLPLLLTALAEASDTTDANAGRFALACVQLQGEPGIVVGTDGRQLLWQAGFSFPWSESLLVSGSRVFAAPELTQSELMHIGQNGDWVFLVVRKWTIALRIVKDARYPAVEQVFPKESPTATLHIPLADREFLAETITKLPSADDLHDPVTVDLNGEVAVRAIGPDQSAPTELVLAGSRFEGQPLRINVNRKFLRRAMQLGFEVLQMADDEKVVLCDSGPGPFPRKYVFMPLSKESPVLSAPNALRTVSPGVSGNAPTSIPNQVSHTPMAKTTAPADANSAPATTEAQAPAEQKRPKKATPSSLDQAIALRTALREATAKANELVRALKRDQRQQRIVKETLRSLKQLQAA